MADSKLQRIARIRMLVTTETYQQALRAIAVGRAVPGLSSEYSSAISRDHRKGDYAALSECPECEAGALLDLLNMPKLHRVLPEEEREALGEAMNAAFSSGGDAAVTRIFAEVDRLCPELTLPRIDAAWLCLVCTTGFGENDVIPCDRCGQPTTDTDTAQCGCWMDLL
ncbi:hypothetical protein [Streptomyces sp. NRRL S-350]|uniref:hypothetical protein n=1 Tax=Streptomyces sp. NRRL S-350 TaxID=1463902 RepID=UPI0004C22597|nr:hypothetical protein [Streptomyces sp. NRRL S-350]